MVAHDDANGGAWYGLSGITCDDGQIHGRRWPLQFQADRACFLRLEGADALASEGPRAGRLGVDLQGNRGNGREARETLAIRLDLGEPACRSKGSALACWLSPKADLSTRCLLYTSPSPRD